MLGDSDALQLQLRHHSIHLNTAKNYADFVLFNVDLTESPS